MDKPSVWIHKYMQNILQGTMHILLLSLSVLLTSSIMMSFYRHHARKYTKREAEADETRCRLHQRPLQICDQHTWLPGSGRQAMGQTKKICGREPIRHRQRLHLLQPEMTETQDELQHDSPLRPLPAPSRHQGTQRSQAHRAGSNINGTD